MTITQRKVMLNDVISDRVKQTAFSAWWNFQQKPTITGTYMTKRFK